MSVQSPEPSLRQCRDCLRWIERALFPPKSARCKECHLARARQLSRTPEQIRKRKERYANRTSEWREADRERGRRRYANRTEEQEQREHERRQARKEADNARARELRAQSPERRARQRLSVWKSTLKQLYGISPEDHELIYKDQEGRCFLCGSWDCLKKHNGLVVDHDRCTGHVRGLLCRTCNANFIDEYAELPEELRNFPRANAYLHRGETGDYIESIKQRAETEDC